MLKIHYFLCFLVCVQVSLSEKPMSIINMPGTVRIGNPCNISFIFININFNIKATITFNKDTNNQIQLLFDNGQSRLVSIQIPNIPNKEKIMCEISVANKEHGYSFEASRTLIAEGYEENLKRNVNIFIQSEKPIYVHLEIVKLRIMITDRNFIPISLEVENCSMSVANSENDIIEDDQNGKFIDNHKYKHYGILEYKYLIPANFNVGKLYFEFQIYYFGQTNREEIQLDLVEYVMPTYQTYLQETFTNDSIFQGINCVEYFSSKQSEALDIFENDNIDSIYLEKECSSVNFNVKSPPRDNLSPGVVNKEHLNNPSSTETNKFTKIMKIEYNGKMHFTIKLGHNFKFAVDDDNRHIPFVIKLVFHDSLLDIIKTTELRNKELKSRKINKANYSLLKYTKDGMFEFEMDDIPPNTNSIEIDMNPKGTKPSYKKLNLQIDKDHHYISIHDYNGAKSCLSNITVSLRYNTHNMKADIYFFYLIIQKTSIVYSGTFKKSEYLRNLKKLSTSDKSTGNIIALNSIVLDIGSVLSPEFKLIIFYEIKGRLISDYIQIKNKKCSKTEVSLTSASEYIPGSRVQFDIQARNNSVCSLALIDKDLEWQVDVANSIFHETVLGTLNKPRNDAIIRQLWNDDFNEYCNYVKQEDTTNNDWEQTEIKDSISHFLKAGIHLFSDLKIASLNCSDHWDLTIPDKLTEPNEREMHLKQVYHYPSIYFEQFNELQPQTWLFGLYFIESGSLTIDSIMPSSKTSWSGSVVCLNKHYGIETHNHELEIKPNIKFFISLDISTLINIKETSHARVNVYNNHRKCINVLVTIHTSRGLLVDKRVRLICSCPNKPEVIRYKVQAKSSSVQFIRVKAKTTHLSICEDAGFVGMNIQDQIQRIVRVKD